MIVKATSEVNVPNPNLFLANAAAEGYGFVVSPRFLGKSLVEGYTLTPVVLMMVLDARSVTQIVRRDGALLT